MREKSIYMIEQLDAVKPSTNISNSSSKEKFSDYITEWHIANSTIEKKGAQAELFNNVKSDLENLYPLFF